MAARPDDTQQSDLKGIDPTGTYHGDSDLQLERINVYQAEQPLARCPLARRFFDRVPLDRAISFVTIIQILLCAVTAEANRQLVSTKEKNEV